MALAELDVSGLTCPLTWVKTKLALERLQPGDVLTVRCAPGAARENVRRTAPEAGHAVPTEPETGPPRIVIGP